MIFVGATGAVVRGDVLDCSVDGISRALKDLDPRLYVVWNAKKWKGYGCWEIRIRPQYKEAQLVGTLSGNTYVDVRYRENNLVNHVIDCAFLNYDVIRKLKEMDTDTKRNWVGEFESTAAEKRRLEQLKANEELQYAIRQNKSMARDLKNLVQSGVDPARILTSTKWTY